jgi:hypothetical protein
MFLGGNPLGHIPQLLSLRIVSFEISREDAAVPPRARGIVDMMTRTLENMPPLKDGCPREIRMIFENGEIETVYVKSKSDEDPVLQ